MTDRRTFLKFMLAACGVAGLPAFDLAHGANQRLLKKIPKTGELLPVVGMGTWITFNVGADKELRDARTEVLRAFFKSGGGMIDSSPMYGSAEDVVGYCLGALSHPPSLFSATKVWTPFKKTGVEQIKTSMRLWGIEKFNLLQIHNLVEWEGHLETLQEMKANGLVKYIGITTSHGRRHSDLEAIMKSRDIDFVQLTYNIDDREPEKRLLPLAAERKLAVIANRPFQRGALIDRFERHPLPDWAGEIDASSWAQFLLKFIVSHPSITCAIPATSKVAHMQENMAVGSGAFVDAKTRQRMIAYCASL